MEQYTNETDATLVFNLTDIASQLVNATDVLSNILETTFAPVENTTTPSVTRTTPGVTTTTPGTTTTTTPGTTTLPARPNTTLVVITITEYEHYNNIHQVLIFYVLMTIFLLVFIGLMIQWKECDAFQFVAGVYRCVCPCMNRPTRLFRSIAQLIESDTQSGHNNNGGTGLVQTGSRHNSTSNSLNSQKSRTHSFRAGSRGSGGRVITRYTQLSGNQAAAYMKNRQLRDVDGISGSRGSQIDSDARHPTTPASMTTNAEKIFYNLLSVGTANNNRDTTMCANMSDEMDDILIHGGPEVDIENNRSFSGAVRSKKIKILEKQLNMF